MASARRLKPTTPGRLSSADVARLLARAADGDQLAWNALVDEFAGVVWAATGAYRLSGPDAADVFQTTWMRLVQNVGRIEEPTRLGAWLATTARRECIDVLRRSSRVIPRSHDLPEPASDAPHHADRLIAEQHAVAVRVALQRLGPRDSALLRMLCAEPAPSYMEIGAALNMAVGSIGPTRARALARLRREAARAGLTAEAASGSAA
jgi:RNA polymerase sigma factor (sigma-70 family)